MSEGKVRRQFDRAFKEGAVRLVVEDGQIPAGTARDLGIKETIALIAIESWGSWPWSPWPTNQRTPGGHSSRSRKSAVGGV